MGYDEWEVSVPEKLRADPLWNLRVYRTALYAGELGSTDAKTLKNGGGPDHLAAQLGRATSSISTNIAEGLKTPKAAEPSDRSRLRRATLAEYLRAWVVVEERERLAFDLVTFCGLRASEAYGLRIGDLFEKETNKGVKVQRSWYEAEVNRTKTNETREVGVEEEIYARLRAWIATLPERSAAAFRARPGRLPGHDHFIAGIAIPGRNTMAPPNLA